MHGKSSSLARLDAHQGLFHERNNFGSGLRHMPEPSHSVNPILKDLTSHPAIVRSLLEWSHLLNVPRDRLDHLLRI